MPLRSTSTTPRWLICFSSRARNARRVGPSIDLHGFSYRRLGGLQKPLQLHKIEAEAAVVLARIAQQPAGAATHRHSGRGALVGWLQQVGAPGHGAGDQRFQALLAGIGGHGARESGAFSPV